MGETNSEIINKQDMYSTFQNWALRNYGDTGKTKTVTAKKYERIINILTGEDRPTTENSKFRFWVKAKGFRLGCQHGHNDLTTASVLYVPAKNTDTPLSEEGRGFKRVAVVEDFFDIIYNVHVEMDGRGGRHAGQKRTYRAIAETYSFLPREAVTRFLMSCSDCQKRMHLSMNETMETNNNQPADDHMTKEPPITDFTLPITNTYLNRMKAKMTECFDEGSVFQTQDEDDSMSSVCSLASGDKTPFSTAEDRQTPHVLDLKKGDLSSKSNSRTTSPISLRVYPSNSIGAEPISMADRNGSILEADDRHVTMGTPLVRPEEKSHVDRKRRASSESLESSATKESAADDTKDDEDDNEDEDEDKLVAGHGVDPERLKAFNMFVRLFVDENLDRMVPISKQPKDKIQAILEACDRQFPEFHERSRKRVRTYLKSCRRMRRSKEGNGWDQIRPTPPHLTSAAAEGILAHACENESSNAKRMRMGMDPLPAAEMTTSSMVSSRDASQPPASSTPSPAALPLTSTPTTPTPAHAHVSPPSSSSSVERQPTTNSDYLRHVSPTAPTAFRPPQEIVSPFLTNNNGIFRPGFPNRFEQHPAHHHTPVLQHSPVSNTIQNGPTDLSMKKSSSPSKNQLNPSEVATIKQLIAGYRESAAFLYRSADELEQLLLQQN